MIAQFLFTGGDSRESPGGEPSRGPEIEAWLRRCAAGTRYFNTAWEAYVAFESIVPRVVHKLINPLVARPSAPPPSPGSAVETPRLRPADDDGLSEAIARLRERVADALRAFAQPAVAEPPVLITGPRAPADSQPVRRSVPPPLPPRRKRTVPPPAAPIQKVTPGMLTQALPQNPTIRSVVIQDLREPWMQILGRPARRLAAQHLLFSGLLFAMGCAAIWNPSADGKEALMGAGLLAVAFALTFAGIAISSLRALRPIVGAFAGVTAFENAQRVEVFGVSRLLVRTAGRVHRLAVPRNSVPANLFPSPSTLYSTPPALPTGALAAPTTRSLR